MRVRTQDVASPQIPMADASERRNGIVGGGHDQKYRFTVLRDGLLRYEWAYDGQFEDRPSTFAACREELLGEAVPEYRLEETEDSLEITTSRFQLNYNKQDFTPYGLSALVFKHTRALWRYGEPNDNLGGTYRTLDGVDGRIDMGTGVLSRKGFAEIDDSTSHVFTSDGEIVARRTSSGHADGYLFAYGHDYRDAIKALYELSGPTPVLPRWALGNWWSRYYTYTAQSYIELMDDFRVNDIPLSVAVIDMDWHLVEDPRVVAAGQTGWTGYSWNKELFPDPPAFMKALHDRKLKVTLNDHPADGIHNFEDLYAQVARAVGQAPSKKDPVPFDLTNRAFTRAYFDILLKALEDDGCDFWWIDWQQGPYSRLKNVDPLWLLNCYHFRRQEAKRKQKKHHKPLVFSRYAGPGSHRYPIGFSGDTIVSWASLAFQPEFTSTASNIGYGWWSHDIGGHMLGTHDDELLARWVQLGVLSPVMRLHSSKSDWVTKEPWRLPRGAREVVSAFLRLRHRLIPYLHTMNIRASLEGAPLVQPMYWEYPEREEAYRVPNQYLFGTELLVVPITSPGNKAVMMGKVKGWLPPGRWVDFFSGEVYEGDRELWLSRTLEEYPVFMKEGSIVPLDAAEIPLNGGETPAGYELVIAGGADGRFDIVEDEENEQGSRHLEGGKSRIPVVYTQATGNLQIGPLEPSRALAGATAHRNWSLRLLGTQRAQATVTIHGEDTVEFFCPDPVESSNGLLIKIREVPLASRILVHLHPDPQLFPTEPLRRIRPIIWRAQVEYGVKEALWDALLKSGSNAQSVGQVQALAMNEDLRLAVLEHLLADSRS